MVENSSDDSDYELEDPDPGLGFLRSASDQCHIYICESCGGDASGYDSSSTACTCGCANAKYGDILTQENAYRAVSTYIMGVDGWQSLSHMGPGQGSGAIPRSFSARIEDPKKFFRHAWGYGDLLYIRLDTTVHAEMLRRLTGGRTVNPKLRTKLEDGGICYVVTVPCIDGDRRLVKLNSKTADIYLTGERITEPDPLMIKEDMKALKKYNRTFRTNTEPGRNITYRIVNWDDTGSLGSLIISSRLEDASGNIIEIKTPASPSAETSETSTAEEWCFRPEPRLHSSVPRWSCHRPWAKELYLYCD
jgi:hypothetical protein